MSTERDKRVSIRALLDSGMAVSAVARQTGANRRTVMRVRDEGDAAIERKRHERQNSARPADLVAQVAHMVEEKPRTNISELARETGTPRTTMRRVVEDDLGMRSYRVVNRQGRQHVVGSTADMNDNKCNYRPTEGGMQF